MSLLETYTQVQEFLTNFGETLTFPTFTMLAIPGFHTTLLQDVSRFTPVSEQQNFNFMVSGKDYRDNSVTVDMTFTLTDDVNVYTFNILQEGIPQADGWYRIGSNLIGIS